MSSYNMGFYYDKVKRGEGWTVETDALIFHNVTKFSAKQLMKELKEEGHSNIVMEKA